MSEKTENKDKKSKKHNEIQDLEKQNQITFKNDSDEDKSYHKKDKKHKKSKKVVEERVEESIKSTDSLEVNSENTSKKMKRKSHESSIEKEELAQVISGVNTANNWEKIDLGDDHRKLKFLKLMGASKSTNEKEQNIISRELRDNTKVELDLEKQFNVGITKKLSNSKRQGLGIGDRERQNTHKTFDDETEVTIEKPEAKDLESYKFSAAAEAKLKFKKMSFVKSSS